MSDERRTVGEPHNRLTRLCAAMIDTLDANSEYKPDEDKCIIFLHDDGDGGLVLHGYDNDVDAIADIFIHLKSIFKVNGKDLILVPLKDPVGQG